MSSQVSQKGSDNTNPHIKDTETTEKRNIPFSGIPSVRVQGRDLQSEAVFWRNLWPVQTRGSLSVFLLLLESDSEPKLQAHLVGISQSRVTESGD